MPVIQHRHDPRSSLGPAIAKAIGHMLNELTGRGPTTARAYVSEELISVVLSDSLTTGERSLCRSGAGDLVLSLRSAYQEALAPALTLAVETLSGQTVLAFLSANHLDPDIAIESFVMVPRSAAPADAEAAGTRPGEVVVPSS
jgi:uncharacterized protein YbcI